MYINRVDCVSRVTPLTAVSMICPGFGREKYARSLRWRRMALKTECRFDDEPEEAKRFLFFSTVGRGPVTVLPRDNRVGVPKTRLSYLGLPPTYLYRRFVGYEPWLTTIDRFASVLLIRIIVYFIT